jgi:hypothetical protein
MPYYKNAAASSGLVHAPAKHEDAIASLLEKHGYKIYNLSYKLRKKDSKSPHFLEDMPVGTFVSQPFGTHGSPDFFIKAADDTIIPLEAKSSATASCPTYNSGGVNPDYYYVFCSKISNSTTLFRGCDIITPQQQQLITDHIAAEKLRAKALNSKLTALDTHGRGIAFYPRPMIIQRGGAEFTNYFTHVNRQRDEERAIEPHSKQ